MKPVARLVVSCLLLGLASCADASTGDGLAQTGAATAVPGAEPTDYIVFFDLDRADLMPDSRRLIARVAQAVADGTKIKVVIAGYADTSGTAAHDLNLSFRRASVVEAELIRNGVAAEVISIRSKGENDQMDQSPDGVHELQNRRATIELVLP